MLARTLKCAHNSFVGTQEQMMQVTRLHMEQTEQQDLLTRQKQARAKAQHYDESCDFLGMFEADSFDEEVVHAGGCLGLNRDDDGILQVYMEYVYDAVDTGDESGTGWWL
jgi:hypothetical protein